MALKSFLQSPFLPQGSDRQGSETVLETGFAVEFVADVIVPLVIKPGFEEAALENGFVVVPRGLAGVVDGVVSLGRKNLQRGPQNLIGHKHCRSRPPGVVRQIPPFKHGAELEQ